MPRIDGESRVHPCSGPAPLSARQSPIRVKALEVTDQGRLHGFPKNLRRRTRGAQNSETRKGYSMGLFHRSHAVTFKDRKMSNKTTILKAIGAIGRTTAKLTKDVQACAVDCVMHAVLHGDVTLADHLVDALGKQGRKASLRAWFEINGCMFIAKGSKTFSYDKYHKLGKADTPELREALMAKPWEDAVPEPQAVSVLEISAKVDKFLDNLTKQANEASTAGVPVHGKALLDYMVKAAAEFHARQVLSETYDLVEEGEAK